MARAGKTHTTAGKRFKVTGSGKIMRRRGRFAHLLTKKSSARKRRLGEQEPIAPGDAKAVRRMLG